MEFTQLAALLLDSLSGEYAIEFAFSGVFIILWMTGHTLNVMSMIGAIMLIGIVVKNGRLFFRSGPGRRL